MSPSLTSTRSRRRRRAGAVLLVLLAALAAGVLLRRTGGSPLVAGCSAAGEAGPYPLDLAQAANAATIASVGVREGLGDHAVTVALATAFQESKLHNLPYGDLDSVGLFQQRPSQGWGPRERLLDPHFAATAFFAHLGLVPGWRTLPVADAAQAVQRSASGSAYAGWETEARALARALTGEVPHGLTCTFSRPAGAGSGPAGAGSGPADAGSGLPAALSRDVGGRAVGTVVPAQAGWRTAAWLVAQAAQYDIEAVSFDGLRWTRASDAWRPTGAAAAVVRYTLGRPRG